jgi:hypothetical protein
MLPAIPHSPILPPLSDFTFIMNLRLILPAAAAILMVATSCKPYEEPPPPAPTDPAARTRTPEEEERIRKQREQAKKEDEAKKEAEEKKESGGDPDEMVEKKPPGEGGSGEAKPPERTAEIQVARPVPGKPGFVFSPFNNKVIDVKGIPSGRLVADPTYPASEKKHFRVP